jgi:hypothetical protein
LAYPPAPRIDWAPDGERTLACTPAGVFVHAPGFAPTALPASDALDARWRADGTILVVSATGTRISLTAGGAEQYRNTADYDLAAAMLARDGERWIAVAGPPPIGTRMQVTYSGVRWPMARRRTENVPRATDQVIVLEGGTRLWTLDPWIGGIQAEDDRWSIAIAPDGSRFAVGYETRSWDDGRSRVESGRGWLVLDTERWQIGDRAWHATVRDDGPMRFAFDRAASRFAAIAPERAPQIGAVRLGGLADHFPRTHAGGAHVVAFDERGLLAAYGYPAGVGPHRLRVDYLARWKRGRAVVEIDDTLWLEPGIGDIAALAFDPSGRRIACLATDGAVEVVPVP